MNGIRTLVIGGGGLAGLGWLAGLLFGLKESGVDLRDADQMIGTSAGSATAAQLRSAQSIETLFARQTEAALLPDEPPPSGEQLAELMAAYPKVMTILDNAERLRAIGSLARGAKTVAPAVRRAMIERRVSEHVWPDAALIITAVDLETSALVTFDSHSGVSLVDAVSASCAVPGIWPIVEIEGRAYMDGGVYSVDNAHLAAGSGRVIIMSPLGGVSGAPPGLRLDDQVAALETAGTEVLVIEPATEARSAMGRNPFDPAIRTPAALAGRAQGAILARKVSDFWT